MDWQLPDIGKTMTNNILPSSLSAYAVRILCRLAVFGYFRIVSRYYHGYALVCIVGKNRFNNMNHVGHVLNDYFNRTNPQWRCGCKIIITQTNTCLEVFSPGNVIVWIKNSTIRAVLGTQAIHNIQYDIHICYEKPGFRGWIKAC